MPDRSPAVPGRLPAGHARPGPAPGAGTPAPAPDDRAQGPRDGLLEVSRQGPAAALPRRILARGGPPQVLAGPARVRPPHPVLSTTGTMGHEATPDTCLAGRPRPLGRRVRPGLSVVPRKA